MSKLTFVDLPGNVQQMVIDTVVAINKKNGYIDESDGHKAVAQAISMLAYGSVSTHDEAAPGADQTAYQQAEPAGPNPDYKDPEIFDPKASDDSADALSYLFSVLRDTAIPKMHCGRTDCEACNAMFGKPDAEVKPESNKLSFVQVDHKEGAFGPVDIYRSSTTENVYAIMNRGKTAVIESPNMHLMPYQMAVEIVKVHGKADRSIVG